MFTRFALLFAFLLAVAVATSCVSQPVVDPDPPDEPEPEACAAVIDCTEETLGTQTRGVSNQCFECVETSEPRAPFAWALVAPCSIPERE